MADELKPCVDSSRDGNGRPGSGIIFPAVDKLLRAVSELMDACDDTGTDRSFALSLVTRRENELISAAAKHDAKVAALRAEVERLRAENAKALRAWDDGAAIRTKENDALRAEVAELTVERDRFREMFKAAKLSVCDLEAKLDKRDEPLTDEQAERAFAIAKENGVGECDTLAHGVQGIDAAIRRVRRGE